MTWEHFGNDPQSLHPQSLDPQSLHQQSLHQRVDTGSINLELDFIDQGNLSKYNISLLYIYIYISTGNITLQYQLCDVIARITYKCG